MDTRTFAIQLLSSRPEIANTPMGQQFLRILQTGDIQAGQQMAQNLCASRGLTPEQAVNMARSTFNL